MLINSDYKSYEGKPSWIVVIGNFDGIHWGHRAIIEEAKSLGDCMVITFDPHPSVAMYGKKNLLICDQNRKMAALRDVGVKKVLNLNFAEEIMHMSPEEFVNDVLVRFAKTVVVGQGFRFGNNRSGDCETLKALCNKLDIDVVAVDLLAGYSSSFVRMALAEGNLVECQRLLNRPYELRGLVNCVSRLQSGGICVNMSVPEVMALPRPGNYLVRAANHQECVCSIQSHNNINIFIEDEYIKITQIACSFIESITEPLLVCA